MNRVVVIGGGIAGLTAAFSLASGTDGPAVAVTLLEASERTGGKVRTEDFAGLSLDAGPDSFLARSPAAAELCRAVGLGEDLVAPGTGHAYLWSRGRLRSLPSGLVLGVPTDLVALARSRILSPWGVARAALDLVLPASHRGADEAVGALIRARLGAEAQARLVDPLVGGINAARTDDLSLAVAAPQLADAVAPGQPPSLIRALRARRPAGPPIAEPVFLTVRGGLERLTAALTAAVAGYPGSTVERGVGAAALAMIPRGDPAAARWWVTTTAGTTVAADAVVLAVPAPAAARLLAAISPVAAAQLAGIAYSSVALATMAYCAQDVGRRLDGSGLLVPRIEGRLMTACTWTSSKWPHLDTPGQVVLRVSAGRAGDVRALALSDEALIDRLHEELRAALDLRGRPREARVHRWIDAFPQFAPGHLAKVAEIERALDDAAPALTLAGAAYRGVGLATCIVGAQAAAGKVRAELGRGAGRIIST